MRLYTEIPGDILLSYLISSYLDITIKQLPGPLFTKWTGVLPQNLVKSRSREIGCYNDSIALKFDRHLDSAAVEVPDVNL